MGTSRCDSRRGPPVCTRIESRGNGPQGRSDQPGARATGGRPPVARAPGWYEDSETMQSTPDWSAARARVHLDPAVTMLNTGSFGPTPKPVFDRATELRL